MAACSAQLTARLQPAASPQRAARPAARPQRHPQPARRQGAARARTLLVAAGFDLGESASLATVAATGAAVVAFGISLLKDLDKQTVLWEKLEQRVEKADTKLEQRVEKAETKLEHRVERLEQRLENSTDKLVQAIAAAEDRAVQRAADQLAVVKQAMDAAEKRAADQRAADQRAMDAAEKRAADQLAVVQRAADAAEKRALVAQECAAESHKELVQLMREAVAAFAGERGMSNVQPAGRLLTGTIKPQEEAGSASGSDS